MDALGDLSLDVAGCGPKGPRVGHGSAKGSKLIALGQGSAPGRHAKTKEPAHKKRKTWVRSNGAIRAHNVAHAVCTQNLKQKK